MKYIRSLLFVVPTLLAMGCSSQKAWVYRANSYSPAEKSSDKSIAVLAYSDARENKNSNAWLMYMVPAMPFGWQNFDAPEGSQMHMTSGMWLNYKPTEDFPKALAEDLRNTGLFSEAFFDFRRGNSDFAVSGKILSTSYKGYIISYGLSVYGPLLWIVGFPASTTSNELEIELTLLDSKTEAPLFTKVYNATPQKGVSWLYVMKDDFNYSEMLAEVNKQFCQDIQPYIVNAAAQALITP